MQLLRLYKSTWLLVCLRVRVYWFDMNPLGLSRSLNSGHEDTKAKQNK